MSFATALALVLFQAAAATPAPTPAATPTPTARPVSAGPRTLQDLARERRLATTKGKGSVGTISVGPSTASSAPSKTPATTSGSSGGETIAPAPAPLETSDADVRVVSVTNDGVVDGAGAVRVNGTIRNAGYKPVCNVVIGVKILDNKGFYLASGQAAPDVNLLPSGETASFHVQVQAPPGVRGARTNPDRRDLSEGSTSMGGDWKLLGGSEASVLAASESCGR